MGRKRKTPAAVTARASTPIDRPYPTLGAFRAQAFALRYSLPIEAAGLIASLALGSAGHA